MSKRPPLLSIVTPAYNEEKNLSALYQRLCQVLDGMPMRWEWVVVDDHSSDATFEALETLAGRDERVRGFRLSRNFGSHMAIACGLHHAVGDCVVVMAADMQDPPEVLPTLLAKWREGNQVVWAVRGDPTGKKASTRGFSRLYYFIMRNWVGIRELPASGADFFLIDRRVVNAFRQFNERNVSIFALLTWLGFRQTSVFYEKKPRLHGRSGWSLGKKIKLVIDSITSFSFFPIRLMSCLGFIIALLGFLYACFIIVHALIGHPPAGWASLIVVVLITGGIQMLMMGVLGEYLWRTLDESRQRPSYIIEANIGRVENGE